MGRGVRAGALAVAVGISFASAASASPGALTNKAELVAYRAAADAGHQPEKDDRSRLLSEARAVWQWGSVSGEYVTIDVSGSKKCRPANGSGIDYLLNGASDAYAQALGSFLANDTSLAQQARTRVLDLVDTTGFHGLSGDFNAQNQCVLDLALSVPIWIESARLLEDTSVWSAADTAAFRSWLAVQVYPRVAWASRARRNNWGAAGSLSAYLIARYLDGGTIATLTEVLPTSLALSPAQAAAAHVAQQVARIGSSWVGDAQCSEKGIQSHGGIPEELRRGSTGCSGTYLLANDSAYTYQMMHVELLVFHAEALRRIGDLSLYNAKTSAGTPAILQAIRFVIANPTKSWPWASRWGALITANSFYDNPEVENAAAAADTFRGGRTLPYARITARQQASTGVSLGIPGKPQIVN